MPIGLATPCREIENTCRKAYLYKRCGLRPKHYIIPLDSGCGRTTLVRYMVYKYKEAGVLDFTCSPDDYIEISFDGTMPQLKQAFSVIDSSAVYANEYSNIIGMDISGISFHLGEKQFTEFLKNCKRVCEHAVVIFFVHTTPSRNEERLITKLCEAVDNIRLLEVESYTKEDICTLIIKTVAEHGIRIKHENTFREALENMVSGLNFVSAKDAVAAAWKLIDAADFSGSAPTVDKGSLRFMNADQLTIQRGVK